MNDQPPKDLVLEYLRRIDDRTRAMQLDIEELKSLANIHRNEIANLKRENDHFYQLFSRITERLQRIDARLQLAEP